MVEGYETSTYFRSNTTHIISDFLSKATSSMQHPSHSALTYLLPAQRRCVYSSIISVVGGLEMWLGG